VALALSALFACQTERTEPRSGPSAVGPAAAPPASPAPPSTEVNATLPAAPPPAPFVALSRPAQPLNVILLSIEAWRADMPWSGYARPIAPNLTRLAAESTVWEGMRAVSSHTPQSLAALLSGSFPSSLYRDGAALTSYASDNTFFPELLQAKQVRTLAVQADGYLGARKGLEQGFDVWETIGAAPNAAPGAEPSSERSVSRLMALLGQPENTGRQFFAWAHLGDLRADYVTHPEAPDFGKQLRDRYDGEVFFVDLWLGKLLEFARRQAWWSRTAVIVTGAHGEAFGEHGMLQHGAELWDVLLRTPLLIHAPGAKPTRVLAARSQLDLAPTILELMGQQRPAQLHGHSLVPELYGAAAAARPALLFELSEDAENAGLRALLAGDEKLVVASAGGPERLYDLKADPGELEDVAERRQGKLIELAVRFEREWEDIPSIQPHGGMKLSGGRLAEGPEHAPR
jgi:choline-sulfatase